MAQEIEIKLEVPPAALERLEASARFGERAGEVRREEQRSVYFDTPRLELRDEGVALRVRHIGDRRVQTVKAARPEQALARQEFEQEIEGDAPDLKRARGAGRRLTKKLGRRLAPVFETRVERTILPVRRNGSELEIAIDRGEICAGERVEPISEIEVELKGGELGALVQMARALAAQFEVRYGVRSKAERGYALFEKAPVQAVRAEDIELPRSVDVAAGFQVIGLACLRHFALNEQALQRGDAEGVHQTRVGLRRLRAAMSLFKDLVCDEETEEVKEQLRWLTAQLGPARDYDVLVAESVTPLKQSDPHKSELEKLEVALHEGRQEKLEVARSAVASDRCRQIVLQVALWLLGGNWTRDSSKRLMRLRRRSLRSMAGSVLAERTKKLCNKLRKLEELDGEQRHKLRIAVKKLHYGTEFFATLFPSRAGKRKAFLALLKELQDDLGRLNDISIHAGIARDIVHPTSALAAAADREAAFGIGLVTGIEQTEARDLLRSASRAGRRLRRAPAFWS
ncbi:CHAD domain-containing protein [Sorangium sp. So ce726]|uniref:CYTH and CHAD domain-containing protein n=1 Tax=Sorangium sp. So ce726 TaxID=3133319 RepID=UPI003F5E2221